MFLASTLLFGTVALATPPLRYAEDRAPAIVNPLFATSMAEARIHELVFEGLFTDDLELRTTFQLARSSILSDDRRSMRIELRDDVRWHDGRPFTSADVLFTIAAMKHKDTASTEAGRVAWIGEVRAEGDHVVVITFPKPEYAPEDKLHFKILPAHAFSGPAVQRNDPFRTKPIGTGPYKVAGFNDDNSVTLARNLEYWGPTKLDELVMREIADKNYQSKLLTYESVEALVRVLPRDLSALQNDRKIELYPYQTNSWWYVGYNLRDARLKDVRVRQAVELMLDKPGLLAPIGTGDLVTGPFVTSSPFYNHDVAHSPFSPTKASELLTAAGYTKNGMQWEKDGKPLTLRIATQQSLETAQDVVINLQSQLQAQGVVVEPVFLPVAEWKQKIWRDKDYDLVLSQWSFDRNEDIHEQFFSTGTRNFGGYANPEVDKLLTAARAATDPAEKKALLRQAHAKIAADSPMIFLWTLDSYAAMSTKVQNVVVHPFYFFTWARDWYIP